MDINLLILFQRSDYTFTINVHLFINDIVHFMQKNISVNGNNNTVLLWVLPLAFLYYTFDAAVKARLDTGLYCALANKNHCTRKRLNSIF